MMSELPPIRECGQIQNMTTRDANSVVKYALKLFRNEKECSRIRQQS
jgi:hypothetical protein